MVVPIIDLNGISALINDVEPQRFIDIVNVRPAPGAFGTDLSLFGFSVTSSNVTDQFNLILPEITFNNNITATFESTGPTTGVINFDGEPLNAFGFGLTNLAVTGIGTNSISFVNIAPGTLLPITNSGGGAGSATVDFVDFFLQEALGFSGTQGGERTITVTAMDGDARFSSLPADQSTATANFILTFDEASFGPVANSDLVFTSENTPIGSNVAANGLIGGFTGGNFFLQADTDMNGDELSIIAVNGEAANVGNAFTTGQGGSLLINADGTFNYIPGAAFDSLSASQSVNDSVTYTISDGNGNTDTTSFTITVNGVNDAPVFEGGVSIALDETNDESNITGMVTLPFTDVDVNDTDQTAVIIGVSTSGDVSGLMANNPTLISFLSTLSGFNDGMSDGGNFTTTFTAPSTTFDYLSVGDSVTITYTAGINDGDGGIDTTTFDVVINGTNDAPTANDDVTTINENTDFFINVPNGLIGGINAVPFNFVADTDPDGDPLTIISVDGSAANVGTQFTTGGGALATIEANGSIDYFNNGAFDFLTNGETATDTITYTVSDGNGGTSSATLRVTINGVNDAPVANDDAVSTSETVPVGSSDPATGLIAGFVGGNFNLQADTDAEGETLTITAVAGDAGNVGNAFTTNLGGSVTINADGSFNYNPGTAFIRLGAGDTATDVISYTVSDGNGATSTANLTVTINGVNDAPVVTEGQSVTTDEDTSVSGVVLARDINAGTMFTFTQIDGQEIMPGMSITLASGALVTADTTGAFEYNPNGQFESLAVGDTDTDSFTVTVIDNEGGEDTQTFTINITGVNDDPVVMDDLFVIGEADFVDNGMLLANDRDVDASDVLRITGTDQFPIETNGITVLTEGGREAAIFVGDGSAPSGNDFLFNTIGNFSDLRFGQSDSFTFDYTVDDGNGGTDTATATVIIEGRGTSIPDDFRDLLTEVNTRPIFPGDQFLRFGTDADDVIAGGTRADVIFGRDGDDRIVANNGNDTVFGDAGEDTLVGGGGRDALLGGDDDDRLDGGGGRDTLLGGSGDDTLQGRGGADEIEDGAGNDLVLAGNGGDTVFLRMGNDTITLGGGADLVVGEGPGIGVDTITDFRPNQGDQLDLRLLGVNNAADAMAIGSQDGNVAVLDFGGGDMIRLRNIDLDNLTDDDFVEDPMMVTSLSELELV